MAVSSKSSHNGYERVSRLPTAIRRHNGSQPAHGFLDQAQGPSGEGTKPSPAASRPVSRRMVLSFSRRANSKTEGWSGDLKPMPMFPVAPSPRHDVDQAPIAQQVEAAPGEIELDEVVRAQSSAPQVVERLTTLDDCL